MIELLLYAALLGILANAVFAIFYKADQLNRLLSRRLFDLQGTSQICKRLKEDVRSARGFLSPDMEAAGPACPAPDGARIGAREDVLVLDCGEGVRISYSLENGHLVRKRYEGEVAQKRTFRPHIIRLRFSYDAERPEQACLVTVNIELKRHSKTKGRRPTFSSASALRSKEIK